MFFKIIRFNTKNSIETNNTKISIEMKFGKIIERFRVYEHGVDKERHNIAPSRDHIKTIRLQYQLLHNDESVYFSCFLEVLKSYSSFVQL